MVEYVFSDKTGTLTCNIMEFRKMTAGRNQYGSSERTTEPQEPNVNFNDDSLHRLIRNSNAGPEVEEAKTMLTSLALCHDIVIDTATGKYNAASPDELALVNFAKQEGFKFDGYDENDNMLVINESDVAKYKRLHVCDFTSSRKRMSVIVEDEDGKIKLICKGADSIVSNILSTENRASPEFKFTQDQVDFMANEGLRTLFVAEKEIQNDSYFQEWLGKVKQARNMA